MKPTQNGTAGLPRVLRGTAAMVLDTDGVITDSARVHAAASASRHARELLEHAGVLNLFDALVDGGEAARLQLPGKPDPALFLEAARLLGIPASRTAVVEDALAGVEAGLRGGFGLVIGVDRARTDETRAELLKHGADIVVRDLAELLAPED